MTMSLSLSFEPIIGGPSSLALTVLGADGDSGYEWPIILFCSSSEVSNHNDEDQERPDICDLVWVNLFGDVPKNPDGSDR
jgi:hypothetical protein